MTRPGVWRPTARATSTSPERPEARSADPTKATATPGSRSIPRALIDRASRGNAGSKAHRAGCGAQQASVIPDGG